MKELSVVIPCYNEAGNLPRLFQAVAKAVPDDLQMEVVFVDNGSTDHSARLIADLVPRYAFARSVTVDINQGYGYGILAGLRAAEGAVVGWTHADLQTNPADVVRAYKRFREDLVKGSVVVKGRRRGRPAIDRFFTAVMGLYASLALGGRFSDINAQPKLFPRSLLAEMKEAPHDFSLDLYVLWVAASKGHTVLEYPVEFGRRTRGEAKGGGSLALKWRLTRRTLGFIGELRRRIRAHRI